MKSAAKDRYQALEKRINKNKSLKKSKSSEMVRYHNMITNELLDLAPDHKEKFIKLNDFFKY